MYVRHLRGTPLGNAARSLWYWRRDLADSAHSLGRLGDHHVRRIMAKTRSAFQEAAAFKNRGAYVARYYWIRLLPAFRWMLESRETSNFTYDLAARNEAYLVELLAVATGRPRSELAEYIREIHEDEALRQSVIAQVIARGRWGGYDPTARFGRRVGWYALVRTLKPRVVIETGIEKGLGAMVLCAALLRNAREEKPGHYYGTDIDPCAGLLLCEPYRSVATILYGDSVETLRALDVSIDLFINDSDHSAGYEALEYSTIASKLSERAVIVGDNAHVTDELLKFSQQTGRRFLFFREEPENHWYLGAGIGLSFE
jgi:predicted O-methyltransferase YrrM